MNDWESTHQITEELKNLRSTVRRFGVYFVILTMIPIVLFFCLLGGVIGGASSAQVDQLSESALMSQMMKQSLLGSQERQQIQTLTKDIQRLQQALELQARQANPNPRPINNPSWIRKMPSN